MDRAADVRSALEDTLASIPNTALSLYGWGVCPEDGSFTQGWRISLQDTWAGASADMGYKANVETGVALGISATMGMLIHEFGHALGFHHELLRDDITGACMEEPNAGSETGHFLTAYDDASFMNGAYCPGQDYSLTELDKIAIAYLYPETELPMHIDSTSFPIGFGGGYAVRDEAVLTSKSGWVRHGILEEEVNTNFCGHGYDWFEIYELDESVATEVQADFKCIFYDSFSRQRMTAPLALVRSSSKHAAVLSAAIF